MKGSPIRVRALACRIHAVSKRHGLATHTGQTHDGSSAASTSSRRALVPVRSSARRRPRRPGERRLTIGPSGLACWWSQIGPLISWRLAQVGLAQRAAEPRAGSTGSCTSNFSPGRPTVSSLMLGPPSRSSCRERALPGAGLGWRVIAVEPNPVLCEASRDAGLKYACADRDQDDVPFEVVDSHGTIYQGVSVSFESLSSLRIKTPTGPSTRIQTSRLSAWTCVASTRCSASTRPTSSGSTWFRSTWRDGSSGCSTICHSSVTDRRW